MKKMIVCLFLLPMFSFSQEIPKFTNTIFVKGVGWQQVKDALLHQGYSIAEQNERDGTIITSPRECDKNDVREIVYNINISDSVAKITGKYINNYGSRAVGDVEYWKSTVSAMHFIFLFMDDFAKSLPGQLSYAKL